MFLLENFITMISLTWSFGFQLLFITAIYLIPVFIAYSRKLEKRTILTIINILLGWTFIAWVACIAWSILGKKSNDQIIKQLNQPDGKDGSTDTVIHCDTTD